MKLPHDLKYAPTHEWARLETDGTLTVGITDHAQAELGDIIFAGDVKPGAHLAAGQVAGVVESVKTASDIHAPVDGEIIAFNTALENEPQGINERPYEHWIFRMRPARTTDVDRLLDHAGYAAAAGQD